MILTLHACLRYMERIRPGADKREANIVLADAARRARHEGRRTRTGELVWTVDNPDMLLITKHDPALRAPVLVTVLDPSEWIAWDELIEPEAPAPPAARANNEAEFAGLDEAEVERRVRAIVAKVEELRTELARPSAGPWNTWPIAKTIGKRGRRMVDERLLALKAARERERASKTSP